MQPWLLWTGALQLPTYFTSLMVGFALATWVIRDQAAWRGVPPEAVLDLALRLVPVVLIGARALHVLVVDPAGYADDPWAALSPSAGWVFYGGLGAGALALARFARARGLDAWTLADCFAPAVAFGLIFGRLGCLGAGCCHGRDAAWPLGVDVPWAITYFRHGRVAPALVGVPVHPTPVYEAALAFALFLRLRRADRTPGATTLRFVAAYGVGRAFIEVFRGDLTRGGIGPLSTSQVLGLASAALALAALRRRSPAT